MGLFDFFKKKNKSVIKPQEEILEEDNIDNSNKLFIDKECLLCRKVIGYDHYTKQQGKYFHKKCYKNSLKQVLNSGTIKR